MVCRALGAPWGKAELRALGCRVIFRAWVLDRASDCLSLPLFPHTRHTSPNLPSCPRPQRHSTPSVPAVPAVETPAPPAATPTLYLEPALAAAHIATHNAPPLAQRHTCTCQCVRRLSCSPRLRSRPARHAQKVSAAHRSSSLRWPIALASKPPLGLLVRSGKPSEASTGSAAAPAPAPPGPAPPHAQPSARGFALGPRRVPLPRPRPAASPPTSPAVGCASPR